MYLTLDTGSMDTAPMVLDILRRTQVKATFFVANERTTNGDGSLGNQWGGWWKIVGSQGHEFASLTYDRVAWRGDLPGVRPSFRVRPAAGALEGREFTWDADKYCAQIEHAARRIEDFTGRKSLPLFRAPGGRVSARLVASARACGYAHAGVSPAGWLADERSAARALREVRSGDILMAQMGTPGRKDTWVQTSLEPLITGLRERGFCFDTLRAHPAYQDWIATHGG